MSPRVTMPTTLIPWRKIPKNTKSGQEDITRPHHPGVAGKARPGFGLCGSCCSLDSFSSVYPRCWAWSCSTKDEYIPLHPIFKGPNSHPGPSH